MTFNYFVLFIYLFFLFSQFMRKKTIVWKFECIFISLLFFPSLVCYVLNWNKHPFLFCDFYSLKCLKKIFFAFRSFDRKCFFMLKFRNRTLHLIERIIILYVKQFEIWNLFHPLWWMSRWFPLYWLQDLQVVFFFSRSHLASRNWEIITFLKTL